MIDLRRHGGEAANQVGAQVVAGHQVDMQIGGEFDDVHVLAVGAAQFFDVGGALGFGLGGDPVGVDGVDGGFGAHDGDAGLGQGQGRVGVEGGTAHGVQSGAVGLAQNYADFGHDGVRNGRHHLGAVADNAGALDGAADHEAGHVGQKQQGNVEGVAQLHEARGLVGRIHEQHAALPLGLVMSASMSNDWF